MNWDDLRCFIVAARTRSLSIAAKQIGMNHSTILRRLAKLEETLNVRLFERFQSGYELTSAGEELLDLVQPVADQIDGAQRQITGRNAVLSGIIRITTTDTLLHGMLAPILVEFRILHPGIQLQVTLNNDFLNLTQREADVAIRPSNTPPKALVGRRVGKIQTAIYGSDSYLTRARQNGIADHDWAQHDWVVPGESLGHLKQTQWITSRIATDRFAVRVDSLLGMIGAVRAGFGIGMLLCFLADGQQQLTQLSEPEESLDTDVWILTHRDLKQVRRIRALTSFLYESLTSHPAILSYARHAI